MPATPERVRIALDGTPLTGPPGGIARFTRELFRALPGVWPEAEFCLLSDQIEPKPRGLNRRWWALGLAREIRRRRIALFHGTDFAVPYWRVCPALMTVHDLSPWRDPTVENTRVRQRTNWLMRLRIPDFVHTPSNAVREEARQAFAWPPDRIAAVPLAAAPHLHPLQESGWHRPYILYLGTLEERKNLRIVAEAARELWRRGFDFDFVLAGRARAGFDLPAEQRIVKLGEVREEELAALYSGALLTVYPSRYEGFGLPVLEAMQCGSPLVASDLPVLRETGGEAAIYAGVHAVGDWVMAMEALLRDPAARAERRAAGLLRARQYSWRRTAQSMKELYERALR